MKNKISLTKFIRENNALISVFGVFAGVSAYFGKITNSGAFTDILYVIFLLLTTVLGIEIVDRLFDNPKGSSSIKLAVFEYLFFAGISIVATYSVIELLDRARSFSIVAIWISFFVVVLFIFEKFGYLKEIERDSDRVKLIKYIILILISAFMYFAAQYFYSK
jgi:hypothetical protein